MKYLNITLYLHKYYLNMNKDQELFKMVENQIKRRYESAEEEEIKEILSKKPTSKLLKEEQIRPFDQIKRQLETKIEQQNFALKKKQQQCQRIERINFKLTKPVKQIQLRSEDVIEKEKLKSGQNIKKSLRCLKNRDELNIDLPPPSGNLIQQTQKIKLNYTKFKNTQLKLFMKDSEIMMLIPQFEKRHVAEFKNSMLDQNDLEKRADILAKLSLLEVFQSQVPLLEQKERSEDEVRKSKSEMESMKQQAQAERKRLQRVYQNKSIPETQLISQAKEILRLLQLDINKLAKEAFEAKVFEDAIKYKKQLQKLRREVDARTSGTEKLKYLIIYKCQRGF